MTHAAAAEEAEPRATGLITRHTAEEFDGMRRAGQLAAACLDMLGDHVAPGVTTETLDRLAYEFILDHDAIPAPLHYRGYPKSICTSFNHVVCHGIPGDREIKPEDCLNVDVTVILDGWHGDSSRMYGGGALKKKTERLIDVTFECLMRGIRVVRPGATLGDIGHAIQSYAEAERCSVVRDFCGHGLGRKFHEPPNVVHFGERGRGLTLQEGMFFTIEPMINLGRYHVKILNDGWTAVTRDKSLSAQFEHSIGVTATGAEIFTLSPRGLHKPTAETQPVIEALVEGETAPA